MKRSLLLTTCTLLSIAFAFGQTQLIEKEQTQLLNQLVIENEAQTNFWESTTTNTISNNNGPTILMIDGDDDGMDDDWEVANGFNPNNPKDAWADKDGDQILNLFEYQLSTDPSNANSPTVTNLTVADAGMIDGMMPLAENSILVIRLAEGDYNVSAINFFNANLRLMVQGGWNADFTIYDPKQYKTTFFNNEVDECLWVGMTSDNIQQAGIVIDGIEFRDGGDFSLGGALRFTQTSGTGKISVYNCTIYNNAFYGFSISQRNVGTSTELIVANTVFANNPTGGLYSQITNGAKVKWRFLNCTIHNPFGNEGGIDAFTLGEDFGSFLDLKMTNSINWGNGLYPFNFFAGDSIKIHTVNSDIDENDPDVLSKYTSTNSIDADPLFVNTISNNWNLTDLSPCIDQGIDVGLPFADAALDMGAREFNLMTNTFTLSEQANTLDLFPNPLGSEALYIDHLPTPLETLDIRIIAAGSGRLVFEQHLSHIQEPQLKLVLPKTISGMYYLQFIFDGELIQTKGLIKR